MLKLKTIKFVLILLVFYIFPFNFVQAQVSNVVFTTDPQTVKSGEISSIITIQLQDSEGKLYQTAETVDVEFLSSSVSGKFLSPSSENTVTKTISAGSANKNFRYADSTEGTFTITANATGRTSLKEWSASQVITIASIPPLPPTDPVPDSVIIPISDPIVDADPVPAAADPVTPLVVENTITLDPVPDASDTDIIPAPTANLNPDPVLDPVQESVIPNVQTIDSKKVLINEINWTGEEGNQFGEWIELYNDSDQEIDLSGWGIYGNDGKKLIINLTKKIPPKGYYLIARTVESSKSFSPDADDSDQFAGGGLSNQGEFLILKDNQGEIIESLDFSADWPAGDNKTKETMQFDGKDWFTAKATPKAKNVRIENVSSGRSGGGSSSSSSASKASTHVTPAATPAVMAQAIQIPAPISSVIAASPTSSTLKIPKVLPRNLTISLNSNDFSVAIKNNESEDIDLSGLKFEIDDNLFSMPQNTILLPQGKITLPAKVTGFSKKPARNASQSDAGGEVKIVDKPKLNLIQEKDFQEIKSNLQASALAGFQDSDKGLNKNKITDLKIKLNNELHNLSSFMKNLFGRFNFSFLR